MPDTDANFRTPIHVQIAANALLLVGRLGSKLSSPKSNLRFAPQPPSSPPEQLDCVVLGNSISLHGPRPQAGWLLDNGMAASGPDRDYAHRFFTLAHVRKECAYVRNLYPFETDWVAARGAMPSIRELFAKRPTTLIVQLGDNVKFFRPVVLYNFLLNLTLLLNEARVCDRTLCLSTFWRSPIVDVVIQKACTPAGAEFVWIGDIHEDLQNEDVKFQKFEDAGIDRHPKDWSMNMIAQRLKETLDRI